MTVLHRTSCALGVALISALAVETVAAADVPVTIRNFVRAETDYYFGKQQLGKLHHNRVMADIDDQSVVRMNRDTLYSAGVFDLDAGPVTVTLPDAGKRFMSLQVISQDHYTIEVAYAPGRFTYSRDQIGTRYVGFLVRTLANPEDETDLKAANATQDGVQVQQASIGTFEVPSWDLVSQTKIRNAVSSLATGVGKMKAKFAAFTARMRPLAGKLFPLAGQMSGLAALREPKPFVMFGTKEEVDPVAHFVGTALGWGGNPPSAAVYESFFPAKNDGQIVHILTLKDVPVDGFWSVSVYNADGFFQKNDLNAYSVNNLTANTNSDGGVTIQFGGCKTDALNCLPISKGWNYTVRLYRPRNEILDGSWTLPETQTLN